jgi:pyridoxamine 5'-phosphate oxidase
MTEPLLDPLFAPAPGFDQPIAVLRHCHDRIRKQIRTMQNLLTHLPQHGADAEARQAAAAVLKYFNDAAPLHHADEEQDLLPMLQATARDDDRTTLQAAMPQILAQHQQMDMLWHTLREQLDAIASGGAATLSASDVQAFSELYAAHMEKEETVIAPMAKRIFSVAQMAQLGDAMRSRRLSPAVPPFPQ